MVSNDVISIENPDKKLALEEYDYSVLDFETADYLKEREKNLKNISKKFLTDSGEELKLAQKKLAKNYRGEFEKWYTSFGYKKDTVYRLIDRYNLVLANSENIDLIESLPKYLVYEIAKKGADEELKEMVFNGDITTLKEYRELAEQKKRLEEINKEIQKKHDEDIENIVSDIEEKFAKERKGIDAKLLDLQSKLMQEKNNSKNIKAESEKELKELKKASKEKTDKLLKDIEILKKQYLDLNESIEEKAIKHKQQDYYLYGVKSNSKDFERFIERYSSLVRDYFDKLEEKEDAKKVIEVSLSKCKIIIEELEKNLGEVQTVEYTIL